MVTVIQSSSLQGIDALPVQVEVQVRQGTPRFSIIGLGDSSVRESRDRVTSALRQSGFSLPEQILVNLAPADIKKEGSAFDLAIAIGILAASRQVDLQKREERAFLGELSLDGSLREIRGVLAHVALARSMGLSEIFVPCANGEEASLIDGIQSVPLLHLNELCAYVSGGDMPPMAPVAACQARVAGVNKFNGNLSFGEVWGQEQAKRALVIAAAGGHNALLVGPPGCGKSMLAHRVSSILPKLTCEELLEVVRIHSVMGMPIESIIQGQRPFRQPHHVVSDVGLVGGGSKVKPGEATLAHHGVLFLDEFPEYRRSALEALRAPLENGTIQVSRAQGTACFPARFQLIAAMNPCPCGRLGLPARAGARSCECSRQDIQVYLSKLSQPILDRIDLQVELEPVPVRILTDHLEKDHGSIEDPARAQVMRARELQMRRAGKVNAFLSSQEVRTFVRASRAAIALIERAAEALDLSARGVLRMFKVARTIADLGESDEVNEAHIAEALSLRSLERLQAHISRA